MKINVLGYAAIALLALSLTACGPLIGIYLLQEPEVNLFNPEPTNDSQINEEASSNEASQEDQTKTDSQAES